MANLSFKMKKRWLLEPGRQNVLLVSRITEQNVRVQPEPTYDGVWMFRPIFLNILYQTIIHLEMDRLGYRGIKRVLGSIRVFRGGGGFIIVLNFAFDNDIHKQRLMRKLLGIEKIYQFDTFVTTLICLEIWYRPLYLIIYCLLKL